MRLLIDGYNLIYGANIVGHSRGVSELERSRVALLRFLTETLDAELQSQTVVVFDAAEAPRHLPKQYRYGPIQVIFSRDYRAADELIEELIAAEHAPRRLTVVSSDHRLHQAANRRKCRAVDSDVWFAEVVRERRRREGESSPVGKPTLAGEQSVGFWLRYFNFDESPDSGEPPEAQAPGEPESGGARKSKGAAPEEDEYESDWPEAADDIFPPGYGEDLEE